MQNQQVGLFGNDAEVFVLQNPVPEKKLLNKLTIQLLGCVVGVSLILAGGFKYYIDNYYVVQTPIQAPVVAQTPTVKISKIEVFDITPSKITIPSANVNLEVLEGGILDGGEWVLGPKYAFYMPKQFLQSSESNLIIYAHKRVGLFLNLTKIKMGDIVTVLSNSGRVYEYEVKKILTVAPDDLESLRSEGRNYLTLITCDGKYDKERLVVKAQMLPRNVIN